MYVSVWQNRRLAYPGIVVKCNVLHAGITMGYSVATVGACNGRCVGICIYFESVYCVCPNMATIKKQILLQESSDNFVGYVVWKRIHVTSQSSTYNSGCVRKR